MIIVNNIKKLLVFINFIFISKNIEEQISIGKIRYKLRIIKKICIGEMYKTDNTSYYKWIRSRGKFCIDLSKESNPHMIIVGMSGFGKSTLLKSLIIEMYGKGKNIIIFDAHSEHKDIVTYLNGSIYDSRYVGINILALDGMSVRERISEFVGVFKSMYGLGYIQTTKLSNCLWYCYRNKGAKSKNSLVVNEPTMSDLMNELNIFIKNARTSSEKNTLLHLKYRISLFDSDAFKNNNIDIKNLNRTTLFLTGGLNNESRYLYMHELLSRLYQTMHNKDKEKGVHTYLFIDEAQFLIDESVGESSIIRKLIEEGRKYGFGVIMATHMPTRLPKAVVANAATFITFYLREPSDILYSANILTGNKSELTNQIKSMISKLLKNQAMVITTRMRKPIVVQTDDFVTVKNRIDNFSLKDCAKFQAPKEPMLESEIREMKHLGSNSEKFVIKNVDGEEKWFMQKRGNVGIEHEVYVRKISDLLAEHKIKHRIIDNPNGPDILAYFKEKRIAIEYETGKKHILMTLDMLRRRKNKFENIVVVVNDFYFEKYKNKLKDFTIISCKDIKNLLDIFQRI